MVVPVLVGAEALRTIAVHDDSTLLLGVDCLGLDIAGHDAASEDAVSSWTCYLCLVSLMISHAILGSNVHIRTAITSLVSIKHNFTLVVSTTFII